MSSDHQEYISETNLQEVTVISSEMNFSHKRISKELFLNATLSVDKFHVYMHIDDTLQQVRKQIKSTVIFVEAELVEKRKIEETNKIKTGKDRNNTACMASIL